MSKLARAATTAATKRKLDPALRLWLASNGSKGGRKRSAAQQAHSKRLAAMRWKVKQVVKQAAK